MPRILGYIVLSPHALNAQRWLILGLAIINSASQAFRLTASAVRRERDRGSIGFIEVEERASCCKSKRKFRVNNST